MVNDDGQGQARMQPPSPDRPVTDRTRARGILWTAVLVLLVAATSWVVAWSVTPWLVPPYLLLMIMLLSPSAGSRKGTPSTPKSGPSDANDRPVVGDGGLEARPPSDLDPGSGGTSATGSDPASGGATGEDPRGASPATGTATAVKGRRGKGRARKPKAAVEPLEATWMEVAPGKFVRVEAADADGGLVGPHALVRGPAGLEEAEAEEVEDGDAPADLDLPVEAPGSDPAVESVFESRGATPPHGPPDPEWSVVLDERAHAIDGDTPQADGNLEGSELEERAHAIDGDTPQADGKLGESDRLEPEEQPEGVDQEPGPLEESLTIEAAEGEGEALVADPTPESFEMAEEPPTIGEAEGEGPALVAEAPPETLEVAEGPSSLPPEVAKELIEGPSEPEADRAATPEATVPATAAEMVAAESAPEPGEALEVDSIVDVPPPDDEDASTARQGSRDSQGARGSQGIPRLPALWPRGLKPGHIPRVATAARSSRNEVPPGRPIRSHGSSRRPPDPRRLSRRGGGRPRQITRTLPPRSPPSEGWRSGRTVPDLEIPGFKRPWSEFEIRNPAI